MQQTAPIQLGDNDGDVLCPHCGHSATHHDRVEVFHREEDAPTGVHVTQEGDRVAVDACLAGNPSDRRVGVSIRFWCEGCHVRFTLDLWQHKGTSVWGMSFDPDDRIDPTIDDVII